MALEVYVNNQKLELKPRAGIGLTFQVGSIFSPNGRNGNLSNKFDVPKTKVNTAILGNLSNINSASNIPYERNSGKIVQDGVELFSKGFALVDETSKSFKVTVYSGNVSFFDLIKGKKISDINFDDSNHVFNVTNILASFNASSLDYIYPIIDAGNGTSLLDNSLTQNADALILALYISSVLEKMASDVDYELKGTFKLTDQYSRLMLTPNLFGYLQSAVDENTGSLLDVDAYSTGKHDIDSSSVASGATQITAINTVFNTINGSLFSANQFAPNNAFVGKLQAAASGTNECYIPERGEETIQTGTTYKGYKNAHVNETHGVFVNQRAGFTEQLVWLHDITNQVTTQLTSNGVGGTQSLTSISEGEEGYIAYSHVVSGQTDVYLYDIALASTTLIYSNVGGSGIVDYLKVSGGRVIWNDSQAAGGLFIYDIGTTTTKTIRTYASGAVGSLITTDGEYVGYEEPTANDIVLYDYTTATNTVVENQGAFSGWATPHVQGDYVTYFDTANNIMRSYRISIAALYNAYSTGTPNISASARTDTKMAFVDIATGKVFYYNLTTNSRIDCGETDATSNSDDEISFSDNYIAYLTNSSRDIRVYDINTPAITLIDNAGTNQFDKLILSSTDVLVFHIGGTYDITRMYDVNAAAFWTNIINTQSLTSFEKAINNDRIIFTNDTGLSSSVEDRVGFLHPIITPLEINITLVVKEDGAVLYSDTETITSSQGSTAYSLSINQPAAYVKNGSIYSYELYEQADREATIVYSSNSSVSSASFSFESSNKIPYGSTIDVASLFDTEQVNVLRDIINQYGLTIQTNDLTRQVFLNPLDDLQDNSSRAVDWSGKIDLSKTPVVKYRISNYGQINHLKYNADEDVPAETGNGSFNIIDYNLPQEKTIIQLKAAGVVSGLRLGDEHTPTIPLKTSTDAYFDQKKSRILLLDKINKSISWTNTVNGDTGNSTVLPLCYFNKDGKADNLDFDSLISSNYNVLTGMMDQAKFVSAYFRLNAVDISNLDFTVPVYLDVHNADIHINGYFYINKISNFKAESVTKVDLIRL